MDGAASAPAASAAAESGGMAPGLAAADLGPDPGGRDFTPFVQTHDGAAQADFLVEGMHCGGCVARIERALNARADVTQARGNLTTNRLHVGWQGRAERVNDIARAVQGLGFTLTPVDGAAPRSTAAREERELLITMAVAGFAAANVMLLSVSLWAGHNGEMDPATRSLLHWFSALIALPAVAFAGRPFFRSALRAVAGRSLNMDVPISVAVCLAAGVSLWETIRGGEHVWFDSAVTLLFFLLLGRFLDRRARGRARAAAERFFALQGAAVTVIENGVPRAVRPEAVTPGATVLVAAGERIAVDGEVVTGESDVDCSLLTGESVPQPASPGSRVFAGTVNLLAPLTLRTTAAGRDTVLSEVARLMESAEARRGRFVALADRVARLYAPVVHLAAAATFLGWWLIGGVAPADAVLYAIAVLIITCPCALGLAVPAVQVAATGLLMRRGVLVKSGDVLERLVQVDTVVFDKTGTLTMGQPELLNRNDIADADLRFAASLAAGSRHPLARALARLAADAAPPEGLREAPGHGMALATPEGEVRLGRRGWAGPDAPDSGPASMELWLARPGQAPVQFRFGDQLRADARDVVARLGRRGLRVALLSGDRAAVAADVGAALGIGEVRSEQSPADKCAYLEDLRAQGRHVLMVGDGLNDAPALAAAHASLSPTTAADISQTAADAVFQGARLGPVIEVLEVARRAGALVRQNMGLSLAYNAVAVPLAVAGLVTPLIAAICMSASSLVVVGNALRLRLRAG